MHKDPSRQLRVRLNLSEAQAIQAAIMSIVGDPPFVAVEQRWAYDQALRKITKALDGKVGHCPASDGPDLWSR